MSRVSLESVIDKSLINKLRGLASGKTSSSKSIAQSLKGGGGVTVADGLRQGARTMVTAVKNLNSTISVVNVSKSMLEKLGEVTEKMINLTDRAGQAGVGSAGRSTLDREFKKLGTYFKKTIQNAKINSNEFLTVDGLSGIFQAVGLDKESSDSIADVFSQFIIPKKDDALASEFIKGKRPVIVPRSSFSGPASTTTYNIQKLTDSNVAGTAEIATGTNIFVDNDNILNQNPGFNSLFVRNANGTLSSLQAGTLDRNFDTLAVNEHTGYTLIGTTQDLGNNASNAYVAYLVNSSGEIVHRFNDFEPDPGGTFESATSFAISSDNQTISYIQREADGGTGFRTYKVMSQTASAFSESGGSTITTAIDSTTYNFSLGDPVNSFSMLKMSDDGSAFAYNKFDGSLGEYYTVFDAWSQSLGVPMDSFQFIDNNKLVFVSSSDNQVHSHTSGDGSSTALTSGLTDISNLRAVQADTGNSGYFVLDSDMGGGARRVSMFSALSSTATYYLDLQATDSISSLSIAYNISGEPEFGVLGALSSLTNDSDIELYRVTANSRTAGHRFERMSKEFNSLFAADANIRSRANAVRMNVDLKALREQIKSNISALDGAIESLGKNLELARATGLAFLDASNSITSADDAAVVAVRLRDAIRSNAKGALNQTENLEPMLIAALSLDVSA